MKKRIFLAFIIGILGFTGCAADNLEKVNVYFNGKKHVFYKESIESKILTTNKNRQNIVLYTSKNKNPDSKLIVNNEIILSIPKNMSIKEIEEKYGIKFVKFINRKIRLALFKADINSIFEKVNILNENGIKASFNYKRNWKLY